MNINKILNALENDGNSSIINLDHSKIMQYKNDVLQSLQISGKNLKNYHKKLKHYRYCEEIHDFKPGNYIRWIPLKNPETIYLTNGAFLVDLDITPTGVILLLKNTNNNFFNIKLDENIIFQKLNNQENVILNVLKYLKS